jgi:predicted Zn-dependent protease
MVSGGEDAIMLLSVISGATSREAAKTFVSRTNANVIKSDAILINGLLTQQVISEIRTQKEAYRLMSCFVEKEKNVFVFHGLTFINRFQNYVSLFENTMRQFRELSDPRRIHAKPDRIRVRHTKTTNTLENVLQSFGVPKEKWKEMALLNGGGLDQVIPAKTLIKVVEKGS